MSVHMDFRFTVGAIHALIKVVKHGFHRVHNGRAALGFLCACIFMAAASAASGSSVEWHLLEQNSKYLPAPTNFVISPTQPTCGDVISFLAPADGEGSINSVAASARYGAPSISVDASNRVVSVPFSAPLGGVIPMFALPVSGVDGTFGPLSPGTWTFTILTNTYTFTVSPPALHVCVTGTNLVVSWKPGNCPYVLQSRGDSFSGPWSPVTNGITSDGTNCVFTCPLNGQFGYFRLRQQ